MIYVNKRIESFDNLWIYHTNHEQHALLKDCHQCDWTVELIFQFSSVRNSHTVRNFRRKPLSDFTHIACTLHSTPAAPLFTQRNKIYGMECFAPSANHVWAVISGMLSCGSFHNGTIWNLLIVMSCVWKLFLFYFQAQFDNIIIIIDGRGQYQKDHFCNWIQQN